MERLDKLLEYYDFKISMLYEIDDNMVIGGSFALKLHGIIVPREPADLDIIVFMPTPSQLSSVLNPDNFSPSAEYGEVSEDIHSFVCTNEHKDTPLNIILADVPLPENLLRYKDLMVNSIENIIEAKSTYTTKAGGFIRKKDVIDLQKLKSLNFNV